MTRRRLITIASVTVFLAALLLVSTAVRIQLPGERLSTPPYVLMSADGRRIAVVVEQGYCSPDKPDPARAAVTRVGDHIEVVQVVTRPLRIWVLDTMCAGVTAGKVEYFDLAESALGLAVVGSADGKPVQVKVCKAGHALC